MGRKKQSFSDLPAPTQAGVTLLGIAQLAFTGLAFYDLARRPKEAIRGPKQVWIPVILVNWIGPATYFLAGRKR